MDRFAILYLPDIVPGVSGGIRPPVGDDTPHPVFHIVGS
jgi:hypothetical protein